VLVTTRTAIAYVDGFNFYHGTVKDSPSLKWLDFEVFCKRLLRGYHLTCVNYYTARVKDRPQDPMQSQRQDDYLRALQTRPLVKITYGQFQKKKKWVLVGPDTEVELSDGSRAKLAPDQYVKGRTWEEKGSDVNLGTDLSWDAANHEMHAALVLSNDLDLQWPITRAMQKGIEVIVVNPHSRTNTSPSLQGSDTRRIKLGDLRDSQLPDEVFLGAGTVRRPATWV
jgi:uncharacterized LabA/DUF88 family protein